MNSDLRYNSILELSINLRQPVLFILKYLRENNRIGKRIEINVTDHFVRKGGACEADNQNSASACEPEKADGKSNVIRGP